MSCEHRVTLGGGQRYEGCLKRTGSWSVLHIDMMPREIHQLDYKYEEVTVTQNVNTAVCPEY